MVDPVPDALRPQDRPWSQRLLRAGLVVVLALVVLTMVRKDVVTGWRTIASCATVDAPVSAALEPQPDAGLCTTDVLHRNDTGYPLLVPFVLPAAAGLDATPTRLVRSQDSGELTLEYRSGSRRSPYRYVILFVEVPDTSLPPVPFTSSAGSLPLTVTAPDGA